MSNENKFNRFSSYILIFIIIALIYSCSTRKPYIRTKFEGEWTDVGYLTLLAGTRYHFIFRSDSFYLQKHEWTDVYQNTPCHQSNSWIDYYSGIFRYDNDSIYFNGIQTDSLNEKMKKECTRGKYIFSFKYEFRGDTLIFLPREQMRYNYRDSLYQLFKERIDRKISIYLKEGLKNYVPSIGPVPNDSTNH